MEDQSRNGVSIMATTYININGDIRDAASLSLPADRILRGAWQLKGNAVVEDMAESLEIQKNYLRAERAPEMDKLDVEFMLALETGGDTAAIAAKKKALRDITDDARLATATTPDALKVLNLATLLGE
jgi:hypothetical protein